MWRRKEAVDERMAKRGEVGEGAYRFAFCSPKALYRLCGRFVKSYGLKRSKAGLKQIPYVRSVFILLT